MGLQGIHPAFVGWEGGWRGTRSRPLNLPCGVGVSQLARSVLVKQLWADRATLGLHSPAESLPASPFPVHSPQKEDFLDFFFF